MRKRPQQPGSSSRWRPGGHAGSSPASAPWLCVAAFRRVCSEQRKPAPFHEPCPPGSCPRNSLHGNDIDHTPPPFRDSPERKNISRRRHLFVLGSVGLPAGKSCRLRRLSDFAHLFLLRILLRSGWIDTHAMTCPQARTGVSRTCVLACPVPGPDRNGTTRLIPFRSCAGPLGERHPLSGDPDAPAPRVRARAGCPTPPAAHFQY